MTVREEFKTRVADRYDAENSRILMGHFDSLTARYGQTKALTLLEGAFKQLQEAQASINCSMLLSPSGRTINNALESLSKSGRTIESNPLVRLRQTIEKFNKSIAGCSAQIRAKDGTMIDALTEEEAKAIQQTIPKCLQAKAQKYEAFASSPAAKLERLILDVRF